MSKKPASLTSDLLARKGEAEPSPIDPGARMSLFAGPDYGTAGGTGGADEEERPRPPEPEIIYTAEETSRGGGGTRLVIGAVLGAIVIGGILLTLSGKNQQSVAPVAPEITAQGTGGEEAASEQAAPATSATNEAAPQTPATPAPEAAPAMTAAPNESAAPSAPATPMPATSTPATPMTTAEAPSAPVAAAPAEPAPALRPGSEAAPSAPVAETPAPAVAEPAKAPAAPATPAKAVSKGAYVVQISALRDEKSAKTAWRTLVKQFPGVLGGHALDIEKADLGAKGTWYRVRAAGFETKAAAAKACAALKAKGQGCMVKKR